MASLSGPTIAPDKRWFQRPGDRQGQSLLARPVLTGHQSPLDLGSWNMWLVTVPSPEACLSASNTTTIRFPLANEAMAAPTSKTIKNLSGQWTMSKKLSDSMEPGLALQGIGFFVRKGICMATISLSVEQYEGKPRPPSTSEGPVWRIDSTQSAAGLSSTSENRCVDDIPREQTDWVFGTVEGRSHWITLDEVQDPYLAGGWIFDGDDKTLLRAIAVNKTAGWTATQVWGFQMVDDERRYCRNVVIEKGEQRVNFRIVYDYVG
ncbi:hypothetical protein CP533_6888 [Ophiocordyceps camponoti-saundersi (nom. inval.)]|nr:hypothetical protein CP533_6888 [Ophiocordyceps camponoti-saundersi (nom. inval.)]